MALKINNVHIAQGGFRLTASLQPLEAGIYAVMGPSGAGKSSLLAAMAGFLALQDGQILWKGRDIAALPPAQRPMAMLFQDNNLFPHLSAARNIALALTSRAKLTADQTDQVEAALERVGLAGFGAKKPPQLSGGEQSRVALARVMLQDKPILLVDEPFSALGPALKAEMLDLLGELARERGSVVMMVTHDPADALRIAEKTIVVAEGTANSPKDTGTLMQNPPPALAAYLGTD
jgi:thiamine transport system ATP-binding protein